MSRLDAFINTDEMERADVAAIVDDRNTLIKQYRKPSLGDMDGFEDDLNQSGLRFLRNLKGRMDRRNQLYRPNRDEVERSTEHLFIATLYHKDVQIDDILKVEGVDYVVNYVNLIGQSFTEAECSVVT